MELRIIICVDGFGIRIQQSLHTPASQGQTTGGCTLLCVKMSPFPLALHCCCKQWLFDNCFHIFLKVSF